MKQAWEFAAPEYDEQAGKHRLNAGGQSHSDLGCMGCCAGISSAQFVGHPAVHIMTMPSTTL